MFAIAKKSEERNWETRLGAIFGSKEKEGCAVRGKIARAPAVKFDRHVENWRKLFIDFLSLSYPSTLQQNNDTSKEVQRRPVQTKKSPVVSPDLGTN